MTDAQLEDYRLKLEALQESLEEDLAQAKKSSAPVELDQTAVGRVSRIDAIQQQQMQLASIQRLELRLELIKEAYNRIDDGSYGICKICEEDISDKRLEARPESPVCVNCMK